MTNPIPGPRISLRRALQKIVSFRQPPSVPHEPPFASIRTLDDLLNLVGRMKTITVKTVFGGNNRVLSNFNPLRGANRSSNKLQLLLEDETTAKRAMRWRNRIPIPRTPVSWRNRRITP
jgi:hypothetical protein